MAATQSSTRRRTSAIAFGDPQGPPAKKQKAETARPPPVRKKPANYDVNDDGFSFSRRGAKTAPKVPARNPDSLRPPDSQQTDIPRGSASPVLNNARSSPPKPRRRSARLSSEARNHEHGHAQAHNIRPDREPTGYPNDPKSRLHSPQRIALPFADTPIIDKNKRMRKTSGQNRRRSSSSFRGRRASSLLESGFSNAIPHDQIEASEFYKHINQELPEPRRMMQLLTWCGARAMPDKPAASDDDRSAKLAARIVQEELLKEFPRNSSLSNWFDREELPPEVLVRKPNPRNQQNAEKVLELEGELKRRLAEKAAWAEELADLDKFGYELEGDISHDDDTLPASKTLGIIAQHPLLGALDVDGHALEQLRDRLSRALSRLELGVDTLGGSIHTMSQYTRLVGTVSALVNRQASLALEAQSGNVEIGQTNVRSVLGALSRAGR